MANTIAADRVKPTATFLCSREKFAGSRRRSATGYAALATRFETGGFRRDCAHHRLRAARRRLDRDADVGAMTAVRRGRFRRHRRKASRATFGADGRGRYSFRGGGNRSGPGPSRDVMALARRAWARAARVLAMTLKELEGAIRGRLGPAEALSRQDLCDMTFPDQ
jgi:hypothetical protein